MTTTVDLSTLAFIPVNLGPLLTTVTNNLWAWLAVVTAAFSVWRLRSSPTIKPDPSPSPVVTSKLDHETTSYTPIAETTSLEEEGVLTRGNSMKERLFTVYYDYEVDEERENEEGDVDGEDEVVGMRWGEELTVEMRRTGDLGWYSYQDRKVIDGSVVRLWDEKRENCCSPRNCRRRLTVGVKPLVFVRE